MRSAVQNRGALFLILVYAARLSFFSIRVTMNTQ